MRKLMFDDRQRLRNGWWILVYLLVLAAAMAGFQLLVPVLKRHHIKPGFWVEALLFLFTLLATWICTRLRREPLASVGFRLDRRWAAEAARGVLLGGGLILLAAALLWAVGGVTWTLAPGRSLGMLGTGFLGFILVALFEENLFRGFIFQRLLAGLGVWPAQLILALLFAVSHWSNPGMTGATRAWASLDIALAALFLGLAFLRTGSLALPVGIHLGWNWVQGYVLGFGVSGSAKQPGWLLPVFHGRPDWVSGGAAGLEASVFGVLVAILGLVLLWRWRGSIPAPAVP
jgi:membrane protease YdiL (CAAX protease family)